MFIGVTPPAILKIIVCFFIKLRKLVSDKQIYADNHTCADKQINGQDPSPGEAGIGNQSVEQKIIRDIVRTMDERDENKIKYQQENTHCHAE